MLYRLPLLCISLTLIALPSSLSASTVEKFRNQKVIVTEETLTPGETASSPHNRPAMIVFLTPSTAEFIRDQGASPSQPVKRGDTVFQPADAQGIKNSGSSSLSFVRVQFLTEGGSETWSMTGLAPNYKLLLEDRYARAYDIRIPAQSFEPQHTHRDRVVVCLSGAHLEHILPDREKQPSDLKTGEIAWRLGATHIGHNMGQTDLWVIAIEPK